MSVEFHSKEYIITVVYRPSKSSVIACLNELEDILSNLRQTNDLFIVVRDFHIDCLTQNNRLDNLNTFNLAHLVGRPTRITSSTYILLYVLILSEHKHISSIDIFLIY